MWMWSICVLACSSGTDPDALAARLVTNQAPDAVAELAALPDAAASDPIAVWQGLARQVVSLQSEQAAVHAAEHQMLLDAANQALAGPRPADAAASLSAGLAQYPDDPEFQLAFRGFLAAADMAPPEDAVVMFEALAKIHPDVAELHLDRASASALSARYAPGAVSGTRTMQAGAQLEAAVHLLGQLEQEYHLPPDWPSVVASAQRRLAMLSANEGARAALGGLVDVQWPRTRTAGDGLAGAVDNLTASVAAAQAASVPGEVVVFEWIDAALASLDGWTRAVWPAEIASWQAHHDGVRYGVGLDLIETEAGSVFVNRPILDTPAWHSALLQGDRLDRVTDAGRDVVLSELPLGQRLAAAEAALLGEAGSSVEIAVSRPEAGTLTVSLDRGPVKMQTLHGYQRNTDNSWQLWLDEGAGLGYVRLLSFRDYTEADFDVLLGPINARAVGLLLDLRGNPGGDLNAAVQLSDRFIASGLLAELTGRLPKDDTPPVDPETGEELIPWNHAIQGHAQEGLSVVVLVDADTASAAEILAGVLQERAGAVVVGVPTWGKGYTQVLRSEPELGYAVQFTNQIWTLPSGRHLARGRDGGGGIQPDVVVALSPGEKFQVDLLARQRAALRTHHDGTPLEWMETVRRSDLPPLSADPMLLHGELVLRALVHKNTSSP